MAFVDLDEVFEDGLPLPVGGKVYRVPSCDGELGMWCQRLMGAALVIQQGGQAPPEMPSLTIDGDDEMALYRRLLGPVWDELHRDGVSWDRIQLVAQTSFIWAGAGRTEAERFWNSGGSDPKAVLPNRKARRSGSGTGTGAASTSRNSGSTNGMKRQPKKSKRSPESL